MWDFRGLFKVKGISTQKEEDGAGDRKDRTTATGDSEDTPTVHTSSKCTLGPDSRLDAMDLRTVKSLSLPGKGFILPTITEPN
jgi:hypothetical protein